MIATMPDDPNSDHERESAIFIVRDLMVRTHALEAKVAELEKVVLTTSITLDKGLAAGSERAFSELKTIIHDIREDVAALQSKTTKWEGGGVVLYGLITLIGGFIGWLLSQFGLAK